MPQNPPHSVDVWAIYSNTRHLANWVRHFIDFVDDYFAEHPD